ncbi:septation protein SepH [Demequina aurantiaca]|uniref:septation protein SepH n=1 Tax=Demequina aurantiaca TaxID=676200 RepID=UPI0009FEEFFF|nr:septation protein SepH [Demequina aurantiaca]
MTRLSLVGPADDGENLIVTSESGERYTLPISDELRRAIRHARATTPVSTAPAPASSGLSPKEIQQRIRAGLNAAELAEITGEDVRSFEKYEVPVIAERSYIADLARGTRIGRDVGSPVLGDLVADRLASRGVDTESIVWDAWREVDEPWQVAADYVAGGRSVRARWTFDHSARAVTAEDDEARWLTETELLDVPIPKRHLSAVRGEEAEAGPLNETRPPAVTALPDQTQGGFHLDNDDFDDDAPVPAAGGEAERDFTVNPTEALLEDLQGKRGTRESVDEDDVDEYDEDGGFEGFGPAAKARSADVGFSSAGQTMPHPAGSARRDDASAQVGKTPAVERNVNPETGEKRPSKKGRASVPSWDEIVFGAKNEEPPRD